MNKKLLITAISLIIALSIFGCSREAEPEENPQTVINKAITKNFEKKEAKDKMEFKVDANIKVSNTKDNAKLLLKAKGKYDSSEKMNPVGEIAIEAEGEGTIQEKTGNIELSTDIRAKNQNLFFKINNLNIDAGDPQINLVAGIIAGMYKDIWLSIPIDTTELEKLTQNAALSSSDEAEEKLLQILKENLFIKHKKTVGNRQYEVEIDPIKFKNYLNEIIKASGEETDPSAFSNLDTFLNEFVEYQITIAIGSDYTIKSLEGDIKLTSDISTVANGEIKFKLNLQKGKQDGDINIKFTNEDGPAEIDLQFDSENSALETITILEPEESEPFDLGSLFGGIGLPEEANLEAEPKFDK
jgi:hypothetical protein